MGNYASMYDQKITINKNSFIRLLSEFDIDEIEDVEESLVELFEEFDFEIRFSDSGDIVFIEFVGDKTHNERQFFDLLAAYVKNDSFIEFIYESESNLLNEDEAGLVRYCFLNQELVLKEFAVTFDEDEEELSRREL